MNDLAKTLIFIGLGIAFLGVVIAIVGKVPGAGKLPGDFVVKKENFSFYFPLTTCILISLVLTLVFNLFGKK